jgi:hemolysin activation/secretion protein
MMAGLLLAAAGARGQTPQDVQRAIEQNNRIQQENNERLRSDQQELQRLRQLLPSAPVETAPAGPEVPPPVTESPCQNVIEISFSGASRLSANEQDKLTAPFLGRCLRLTDINSLLAAVTQFYVARGMVTTRAYIAPQDMSDGRLDVLVVEGRVEKILLQDGRSNRSVSLLTAFPGITGDFLDLRDLEQGLDQINRLASNNATLDIQPGEGLGSSTVVIRNQPRRFWSAGASTDNYGSKTTGINQLGVNGALYDLARLNDMISLSQNRSFPYDEAGIGQEANALGVSLPYGYYTLTLSYNDSEYRSRVTGTAGTFETTGLSRQTSAKLDRVMYRGCAGRAAVFMSLTAKQSRNYILGELIAASSRDLSVLDLGGNFVTGVWGGGLTLELAYSQGLKLFDAEEDASGLPDFVPRAQFRRINYGLTWIRPITAWEQSLSFSSQWQGQYGLDALFGSEQISVGSFYSVRGFRDTSLAGDRGSYVRNDLTLDLPLGGSWHPLLRPFIGVDAGYVDERFGSPGGTLAGMAAGATLGLGRASFSFTSAWPLHVPGDLHRESNYAFLRASYSL